MVTTTINSFPPEILNTIFKLACLQRSFLLQENNKTFFHITNDDSRNRRKKTYRASSQYLLNVALVSKSWTGLAQALLLNSVILETSDQISAFLNAAPLDKFSVQELFIKAEEVVIAEVLSKINGLKALRVSVKGKEVKEDDEVIVLDISTALATLEHLDIDEPQPSNSFFSSLITPKLNSLSITDFSGKSDFSQSFKTVAPQLKTFRLFVVTVDELNLIIPFIPLCTNVTEFQFLTGRNTTDLLVSAFPPSQLLQITLYFYLPTDIANLLTILKQPSLSNLQSLTLISPFLRVDQMGCPYKSTFTVPVDISRECVRRGITLISEFEQC